MTNSMKKTILALALCIAGSTTVEAATVHVANNGVDGHTCGHPSKPCRSIGKGIERAAGGDTVEVGPGLYGDVDGDGAFVSPGDEQAPELPSQCLIRVDKPVLLVSRSGASQTFISPGPVDRVGSPGFSNLVCITAAAVVFGEREHGFSLGRADAVVAILADGPAANASIGGNLVFMVAVGVYALAPGVVVADNVFEDTNVGVLGSGDLLISGNAIQGSVRGISVAGDNSITSGNILTGNRDFAVTLGGGTGHSVVGNSIIGNGLGVMIMPTAEGQVHGNNILANHGTVGIGFDHAGLVSESDYPIDVTDNYWGGLAGNSIYDLGTGGVDFIPTAAGLLAITIEPLK
jgi:hypothetical protein